MSWRQLAMARGGSLPRDGVRVSKSLKQVRLAIGPAIAAQLGWEKGRNVAVLIGEGEHTGKMRLALADKGYSLHLTPSKKGFAVNAGAWAGLPKIIAKAEAVRHKISDGALEITLPAWGQAKALDHVAAHIATKGITKCPPAFVGESTGRGGTPSDRAALTQHREEQDARRQEEINARNRRANGQAEPLTKARA